MLFRLSEVRFQTNLCIHMPFVSGCILHCWSKVQQKKNVNLHSLNTEALQSQCLFCSAFTIFCVSTCSWPSHSYDCFITFVFFLCMTLSYFRINKH